MGEGGGGGLKKGDRDGDRARYRVTLLSSPPFLPERRKEGGSGREREGGRDGGGEGGRGREREGEGGRERGGGVREGGRELLFFLKNMNEFKYVMFKNIMIM